MRVSSDLASDASQAAEISSICSRPCLSQPAYSSTSFSRPLCLVEIHALFVDDGGNAAKKDSTLSFSPAKAQVSSSSSAEAASRVSQCRASSEAIVGDDGRDDAFAPLLSPFWRLFLPSIFSCPGSRPPSNPGDLGASVGVHAPPG